MVRKDAWYDFNFLKFPEALFVAQDVIYPGQHSICTWGESVFRCFCIVFHIYQLSSSGLMCHLRPLFSNWFFCFDDLSVDESEVLKSPIIIVLLAISPLIPVSIYLIHWGSLMRGAYRFINVTSSWIDPLIIMDPCPSSSFATVFILKSLLSDTSIATLFLLIFLYMEYLFPFSHFQFVCLQFWSGSLVDSI